MRSRLRASRHVFPRVRSVVLMQEEGAFPFADAGRKASPAFSGRCPRRAGSVEAATTLLPAATAAFKFRWLPALQCCVHSKYSQARLLHGTINTISLLSTIL